MNVNWNPPAPRRGLAREWDKFVGPGQTRAELWLIVIPSLLAGLGLPLYAIRLGQGKISLRRILDSKVGTSDLLGGHHQNSYTDSRISTNLFPPSTHTR